jgi:hypothetical protein
MKTSTVRPLLFTWTRSEQSTVHHPLKGGGRGQTFTGEQTAWHGSHDPRRSHQRVPGLPACKTWLMGLTTRITPLEVPSQPARRAFVMGAGKFYG